MLQKRRMMFFVLFFTGSTLVLSRCPGPDWFNRLGTDKCYFVHKTGWDSALGIRSETIKWPDALTECQIRGGKLLTLDDSNEFVRNTSRSNPSVSICQQLWPLLFGLKVLEQHSQDLVLLFIGMAEGEAGGQSVVLAGSDLPELEVGMVRRRNFPTVYLYPKSVSGHFFSR
jgi:hypothetical protein